MSGALRRDPHEGFAELAAGHALHALEPEEEQAFLAHLPSCARCQREVQEHREVLAHLAYAPVAPAPPPGLLARIRAGMQAGDRAVSFELAGDGEPQDGGAEVVQLDRARRRSRQRIVIGIAVAAAAAAVLGLGGWNAALRADLGEQQLQFAQTATQLAREGTRPVPLRTPDGESVAVALVNGADVDLVVSGLADNAPGTVYVLWSQVGTQVRPVGAFSVTAPSGSVGGLRVQGDATGLDRLMLTREQGDEAPPAPRSAVLASGSV